MKRHVDLNEISDGKLYTANDLVKADCHDCKGCSACCQGMGNSIVLDPMDVAVLRKNLNQTFEGLLEKYIDINVVDGIILPNLRMAGEQESCVFLNKEGRCSIHAFRPGICRLFPLGRYYEEDGFKYILQIHECKKDDRSKVKVKKWLDIPNLKEYEKYILAWHNFLKKCEEGLEEIDENQQRILNMYVFRMFFQAEFYKEDFYAEFYERLKTVETTLGFTEK